MLAFCDFAGFKSGKLYVSGVITSVSAIRAPAIHDSCYIAIHLRFEESERGTKNIQLSMIDIDGKKLVNIEKCFDVEPSYCMPYYVSIVSDSIKLLLPHFGEYSLEVFIDGDNVKSLPFYFVEAHDK